MYGRGRVVISELVSKSNQGPSFIELTRIVPPNVRDVNRRLRGYFLVVLRLGVIPSIYMALDLAEQQLRVVEEMVGRRKKSNRYFVVGSSETNPDINFEDVEMIRNTDGTKHLPTETGSTFAVILLHNDRKSKINIFDCLKLERSSLERLVLEDQWVVIRNNLQDMIIYGSACEYDVCEDYIKMIPNPPVLEPMNGMFIPVPYVQQSDKAPYMSLKWCTTNLLPLQLDSFEQDVMSPGANNNCPDKKVFDLQGKALQSTAQKLVINAHSFFARYLLGPTVLTGNVVELTSDVLSLSRSTVYKVLENFRTNAMVTPGKRRENPFTKQRIALEPFNADMIKRIIKGFYSENKAPLAADIYQKFTAQIKENEDLERSIGKTVTPYTLSQKTFRKVLHKLGFKFGKIRDRDTLLQRPQIVQWRGKYLKAIRENRAKGPDGMKVIYLDGKVTILYTCNYTISTDILKFT